VSVAGWLLAIGMVVGIVARVPNCDIGLLVVIAVAMVWPPATTGAEQYPTADAAGRDGRRSTVDRSCA